MLDRLTEALIAARDTAVEARAIQFGPRYASALEGYGDLSRELLNLQNSTKALKKNLEDVVEWVSAQDMGQLRNNLVLMEGKAHQAAYDALRLCAAVRIFEETVREQGGDDLLDFLEEDPNWEGLTFAAQITSISWNQAEGVWYVFWPVRSWTGVEE